MSVVTEPAVQNNITALYNEPVLIVFVTDGFIGIRSGSNNIVKYLIIRTCCRVAAGIDVVYLRPSLRPEGEEGEEDEDKCFLHS